MIFPRQRVSTAGLGEITAETKATTIAFGEVGLMSRCHYGGSRTAAVGRFWRLRRGEDPTSVRGPAFVQSVLEAAAFARAGSYPHRAAHGLSRAEDPRPPELDHACASSSAAWPHARFRRANIEFAYGDRGSSRANMALIAPRFEDSNDGAPGRTHTRIPRAFWTSRLLPHRHSFAADADIRNAANASASHPVIS